MTTATAIPAQPELLAATPRSERATGVELLRLLSAAGIVWFHAKAPGALIAYSGLTVFMLLTVAFSLRRSRPLADVARERARRLLAPWVFWSAVYAALKVVDALVTGTPLSSKFQWYMLVTGPGLHLWYLPFAFVVSCALVPISRQFPAGIRRATTWAILGALAVVACAALLAHFDPHEPLEQWLFVAPAIPLGVALAGIGIGRGPSMRGLLAIAAITLTGCAAARWLGYEAGVLQTAIAIVACALVGAFGRGAPRWLLQATGLSLGVYLLHPLLLSVGARVAPQATAVELAIGAIMLSGLLTAGLQRTPLRRFV